MAMPYQPWRAAMRPASFRGAGFKVEAGGQSGGRRGPLHEWPKRDIPWAEDMGRRGRRYRIAAYVIGPNYIAERDAVIAACEAKGPGTLVHPTLGSVQVKCDGYDTQETRERGGICGFEMIFVEAGAQASSAITADTPSQVRAAAGIADKAAVAAADAALKASNGGSPTVSI